MHAHRMSAVPETRYADFGDHRLAYQVVGTGPDLLLIPGPQFPIDLLWDEPVVAGHLRRLASFSRLIVTDLLGSGSSDHVTIGDQPVLQSWVDGLIAVLDAAGSESASVFSHGGLRWPFSCSPPAIPIASSLWCCGIPMRASRGHLTTPPAFPNRRSPCTSTPSSMRWDRERWSIWPHQAGPPTPASVGGGREVSDLG